MLMYLIFLIDLFIVVFSIYLIKKTSFHFLNPFLYFTIYHLIFITFREFIWLFIDDSPLRYLPIDVSYDKISIYKSFALEIISQLIFLVIYILTIRFRIKSRDIFEIKNFNLFSILLIFITGFYFFIFSNIFGRQILEFNSEDSFIGTLITAIQNWFILLLILYNAIIPKKYFQFLIAFLIAIQAFQGFGRWRLMVDLLFLASLFLVKNGISMPKIKIKYALISIVMFILISQLKYIGLLIFALDKSNFDLPSFSDFVSGFSSMPMIFNFGDLFIIDTQAALIKSIDSTKYFYGNTYISNFQIFLPKYFFPNKDGLNIWLQNLSVNGDLFKINGNVPTLLGESYANFGFLGPLIIITPISLILCILYSRLKKSIEQKKITYTLIFYLSIYLSLFQIFRDGFSSILNFVLFAFFPLLFFKIINIKIISNLN